MIIIVIPQADFELCCCQVGFEALIPILRDDGDYFIQQSILEEPWLPVDIKARLQTYSTEEMNLP